MNSVLRVKLANKTDLEIAVVVRADVPSKVVCQGLVEYRWSKRHSYSLITVSGRGSTCDLKIPDLDVVVPLCIAVTKYLTKVICLFD